jgi:hypothetical protein
MWCLLFCVLTQGIGNSQGNIRTTADSLLRQYISLYSAASGRAELRIESHEKCGFTRSLQARHAALYASPELAKTAAELNSRPQLDTSVVSVSGHFRVHYNISFNAPTYSVSDLCAALDSAYRFEVGFLGFPPPPPDGTNGGDDKLDVYLMPLGGDYGTTEPDYELSPGSKKFTSFIKISNDFTYFPTKGIDAARVTAAHEFHHTIQLGNYAYRYNDLKIFDLFFYEMTSTSMEQFVYPTIKDYLFYTGGFFNAPWTRFPWHSGYDIAIWNLYIQKKFGYDIIRRQWEIFSSHTALQAIELSLQEYQSTFPHAYPEFASFCYYTNYRSGASPFFADAAKMPLLAAMSAQQISGRLKTQTVNIDPVSVNVYSFTKPGSTDTLSIILTDGNVSRGDDTSFTDLPMTISVSLDSTNGYLSAGTAYYINITSSAETYWKSMFFVQNTEFEGNLPVLPGGVFFYPNPLLCNASQNGFITFRLPEGEQSGAVDFSVYDIRMQHVYAGTKNAYLLLGRAMFQWYPMTENVQYIPSTGIYIFSVKTKKHTYSGKLVIVRK